MLWGIACYHDAHVESELKPTFKLIVENFGWTGLLGVAMVYALLPAGIYAFSLKLLERWATTDNAWYWTMFLAQSSIAPGLVVDGILGLPLFTTG